MENKINWKQKLSSRKLWAALVGVVVGLAAAFGLDAGEYTEIAGVVTSCVSVVAYIFAESSVDKAAASAKNDSSSASSAESEYQPEPDAHAGETE